MVKKLCTSVCMCASVCLSGCVWECVCISLPLYMYMLGGKVIFSIAGEGMGREVILGDIE